MDHSTIIGALAAVCSVTSFLPQAWRIVKTRDTAAISAPMYALTVVGFGLWVTYGLSLWQWPVIMPNAICLVIAAFILTMKLLPRPKKMAVADSIESLTK